MRLRSDICACLTLPSGARLSRHLLPRQRNVGPENACKGVRRGSALACEETHTPGTGGGLRGAGRCGLGRLRSYALGEGKDVFCDLTLTMADDKGDAAVNGEYQCSTVGNDGVRDLPAEARLDIRCFDAARAVVAVRDELDFVASVSELLGHLHEYPDVLA